MKYYILLESGFQPSSPSITPPPPCVIPESNTPLVNGIHILFTQGPSLDDYRTCVPGEEFTCLNNQCVKSEWECNGVTDCDDSSDEAPINNCKSEYWGLGVEHLRGGGKYYVALTSRS